MTLKTMQESEYGPYSLPPILRQPDPHFLITFAQSAMTMLGMSDQEQVEIFSVISAILHLGNARFVNKVRDLDHRGD